MLEQSRSRSKTRSKKTPPASSSGPSRAVTPGTGQLPDVSTADNSASPSLFIQRSPSYMLRSRQREGQVQRKPSMLTDYVAGLTTSLTPVRLTVTATEVQKRKYPGSGMSRQQLDDEGLQDLLSNLHSSPTTPQSTHGKGVASSGSTLVQRLSRNPCLAVVTGGVCVAVLLFVLVSWLGSAYTDRTSPYCDTLECRYYAQYLDVIANESVDPCHDFYTHVCSRWLSRDERPVKLAVQEEFMGRVSSYVLKIRVPSKEQSALQKAAQFFHSCVAVISGQFNEIDAMKAMLSSLGVHWPELTNASNLLETMFALTAFLNWGSIVQFAMDQPGFLAVRPAYFYEETLRRRRIMLEDRTGAKTTYEDYFDRMVRIFGADKKPLAYESLLELESVAVTRLNRSFVSPAPTTLRNQSMQAAIDAAKNVADRSVWDNVLRRQLNTTVETVRVVSFENVELFTTFFELVKDLGEANMAYYHGWALVQAVSVIADVSLAKLFFLRDADYRRANTLYCAKMVTSYMGLAFYAGYIRDGITQDATDELSSIVANIQEAAEAKLALSKWLAAMDVLNRANPANSSRPTIFEESDPAKLDDSYRFFPDMTESITANLVLATGGRRRTTIDIRSIFLPTYDSARFLYVDRAGHLVLLPMMFELPFFARGSSFQGVKYGALGGEIADALSSLLFARIAEMDAKFPLYALEIPCVAEKHRPGPGHQIDADDLLLLRRATSLRFLYEAFKRRHLPNTAPLHLRSHAKLTEAQMFFFFWCLIQCGMEDAVTMCNEVLGGFHGFAVAYDCKKGSAMASSQHCDLFDPNATVLSAK